MEQTFFEADYTVDTIDLNCYGRLRTSRLLELVQVYSGLHAARLGFGGDRLGEQNLAWVTVRQQIEISRLPGAGEIMHFATWPGRAMHSLFPRHMLITDQNGAELMRSCVLWVIMEKESRTMILPGKYGIDFPSSDREPVLPMPRLPKKMLPEIKRSSFTVPFSYVDIVGHMNNTRYADAAENILDAPREGKALRQLLIEYAHEIRMDETMELIVGAEADSYTVQGVKDGAPVFTLCLKYE